MRFWLLEHLGERACAACGEVPASGGAPRISHAVTVAGVPIETEMEPAFAIAWGQIFRQGCACGGQREYVYPRDLRSYSAERDALGDHGETVLVRLYHLGQGAPVLATAEEFDGALRVATLQGG